MVININLRQAQDLVERFKGDETKVLTVVYNPFGSNGGELYVVDDKLDVDEAGLLRKE